MSQILTEARAASDAQTALRRKFRQCYQRIAEDDLVKPFEVNKHVRNMPLLRMIGDVSGKKVLDIGSSQGLLLDALKSASLAACIDLAEAYMRVAREQGHRAVVGDGEALPFHSDTFDVVICSDVLEHVLDVEAVVKQVVRVLKQDGTLFAVVPWEEDLRKYKVFEGTYEFTHLRSFDAEVIRKLFQGFRIVRRRGVAPNVERPPHLKILDALPRFVKGLFRLTGVDSLEEWFEQHIPWRIRNRYWKWYWRQLERFPEWDWLWLWFYPPHHMILVLEKHR
ncbi:MAG: class I SAM-dependent methyltransferase [Nitrospiraceae bacterium]